MQIYAESNAILERVDLRRAVSLLTAVCVTGIGAAAISLAFAGMSTIPALCVCLSMPAFVWGLRYARTKPVTYVQSLGYMAYCDVSITIGICVVTTSGVAFVKLAWLVATNAYLFAFHGRVAVGVQAAVTAMATALAVAGAEIRGDSTLPTLIITVATVVLANLIAGWVIYAGKAQFAWHADNNDRLARHDHLTGLLNRRGLQEACYNWTGQTGEHVVVAVIDLNEFKSINDTHGHPVGDQVLQSTAQRLRALAGPNVILARLGGDEFCVVAVVDSLEHLDYPRAVEQALEQDDDLPVTASVGVAAQALAQVDHAEPEPLAEIVADLLAKADSAMYVVKQRKRPAPVNLIERRNAAAHPACR
jgi:diguanylate cyclase (GGDEF)-like protein